MTEARPDALDHAIAELTAEQEEELQLLQEVLDARVDHMRYRERLARFLQHRAEQQEAA